ncbi:hypothetical protein CC86DRAFT_393580 [Ophiobolus disseminans]|uniref:Uncharacterized protein n=1 Tax=Ophiobolus disseminans TaxID=1469910 RepID=A0A6A7A2B5_9PLEO|nr:hypothetical protein CC86DRAFT_393580 [Ophiobolus disseminans]
MTLLTLLTLFPFLTIALGETGSGRITVYLPFTPYWKFKVPSNDSQGKCWIVADCLFEAAGESRKQQFGATALVMGLIPGTIKDIAWPERRLIHVTKRLYPAVEICVLALGLMCIVASTSALVVCYGSLAIMEIYSKRSALGCVAPIFILVWHIIALAPAAIHSGFASLRQRRFQRMQLQPGAGRDEKITSAIQGANEDWPVKMAWGIYYIAGTLVFTSIMAVTVPELVVWVALGLATTGCSRILAFFLCLVEDWVIGMESGEELASGASYGGRDYRVVLSIMSYRPDYELFTSYAPTVSH